MKRLERVLRQCSAHSTHDLCWRSVMRICVDECLWMTVWWSTRERERLSKLLLPRLITLLFLDSMAKLRLSEEYDPLGPEREPSSRWPFGVRVQILGSGVNVKEPLFLVECVVFFHILTIGPCKFSSFLKWCCHCISLAQTISVKLSCLPEFKLVIYNKTHNTNFQAWGLNLYCIKHGEEPSL